MRRRRSPPNTLRTDDQIVTYYRQAAEAIGPHVPFVLQDYPLRLCHGNRAGAKTPRLRPTSRGGGRRGAPPRRRLCSEGAQRAAGDEVALDVERVVNGG